MEWLIALAFVALAYGPVTKTKAKDWEALHPTPVCESVEKCYSQNPSGFKTRP